MTRYKKYIHPLEASVKKEASELNIHKVLIALSGGADSVATALALKNCGIEIFALHCNFHLRGEESDRDMNFVNNFCPQNDIKLEIRNFNVKEFINNNPGTSIEMACRNLRHDWFREKLSITKFDRIATGHNADDNIETFFLNLLRGSGTRGLSGMCADNGIIWRPLLKFHRNIILTYLKDKEQDFVVDSTNLKSDYRRNYLRNKVIPLLKEEWKGFDAAMDKTLRNLYYENKIVEKEIESVLPPPLTPLNTKEILQSTAPLLLIKRYIEPFGPFSTTPEEILDAIKATKPHIRRWKLKNGIVFLRNGNLFVEMVHGESCT